MLIRYADDLVALCHTRQDALEVKARLAAWLAPRGLAFNEDKTRVVTLDEGFDFLGFNVRRYGGKLLIKPSKAAVRRIRERLRTELRSLRGTNAQAVIKRLNPIIRGWAAYYRTQVSSRDLRRAGSLPVAAHLQVGHVQPPEQADVLGRSPGTSASSTSPGKTGGCSATAHSGAYLHRFAWTNIVRHQIVKQRGVTRRPRPDRLLGLATAQDAPADQQDHPMAPPSPGRSLRDLQGHAHRRRGPATNPARVGTLAGDHPQDDRRSSMRTTARRTRLNPVSYTPTATNGSGPALLPAQPAIRACLSRMRGNGHVRF